MHAFGLELLTDGPARGGGDSAGVRYYSSGLRTFDNAFGTGENLFGHAGIAYAGEHAF